VINFFFSPEPPEAGNQIGIPTSGISPEFRIIFCQHWNDDYTVHPAFEPLDY
jgi:hypothetical protein